MVCSSTVLSLTFLLAASAGVLASPHNPRRLNSGSISPHHPFVIRATKDDKFAPSRRAAKRSSGSRCVAKPKSSSSASTSSSLPTVAPGNVGNDVTTTTSVAAPKTTSAHTTAAAPKSSPSKASTPTTPKNSGGSATCPADWPSTTQSGPTYKAVVASPSDPYLTSISDALNNESVDLYNQVHSGDLTYYETGIVACGDTYADSSYTAALSHLFWAEWPGSGPEVDTDRATICGPFVKGRQTLNAQGGYTTVIPSSDGSVIIGGDGLANCQTGVGLAGKCHIPLSVRITNPANGKWVDVGITDRCEGCKMGDIDVTPTVFSAISDMSLGRVPVTWQFNHNC